MKQSKGVLLQETCYETKLYMSVQAVVSTVHRVVIANGITILLDHIPHAHSVSAALCCRGGARDESPDVAGVTHLAEHLLFKRTQSKNPFDIALAIDDFGGEVNAFTDHETMCLVGRVSGGRVSDLLSFFAELAFEENFSEEDLFVEKEIIRQEIAEALDDPAELAYLEFAKIFWGNSALGSPVFGELLTLDQLQAQNVRQRLKELFRSENIIIAVAGNFDLEQIVRTCESLFGTVEKGHRPVHIAPHAMGGMCLAPRPVQQAYLTLGVQWPHVAHPQYLAGAIVSTVMGDGVSSRLFQLLREKHGLAYDVHGSVDSYSDAGALIVGATLEAKQIDLACNLILDELESLRDAGITKDEFQRSINSLVAQLEMDSDSISSRMWRLVETELFLGGYVSPVEWISRLRSLTLSECHQMTSDFLTKTPLAVGMSGNVEGVDLDERIGRFGSTSRIRH